MKRDFKYFAFTLIACLGAAAPVFADQDLTDAMSASIHSNNSQASALATDIDVREYRLKHEKLACPACEEQTIESEKVQLQSFRNASEELYDLKDNGQTSAEQLRNARDILEARHQQLKNDVAGYTLTEQGYASTCMMCGLTAPSLGSEADKIDRKLKAAQDQLFKVENQEEAISGILPSESVTDLAERALHSVNFFARAKIRASEELTQKHEIPYAPIDAAPSSSGAISSGAVESYPQQR
jgi:DNA repair exonuclease SbcCD ATPase subunit